MPTRFCHGEGNTVRDAKGESSADAAESETLCMRGNSRRENREILFVSVLPDGNATAVRNDQKTLPTVQLI